MNRRLWCTVVAVAVAAPLFGQQPDKPGDKDAPRKPEADVIFGPDGPRGPGGPMFMGGPGRKRSLVAQFDKDGDKRLNKEERQAAREFIKKERAQGRGGFGPPGMIRFGPGSGEQKPAGEPKPPIEQRPPGDQKPAAQQK